MLKTTMLTASAVAASVAVYDDAYLYQVPPDDTFNTLERYAARDTEYREVGEVAIDQAEHFSDLLAGLDRTLNQNAFTTEMMQVYRQQLSEAFEEAYSAITRAEGADQFDSAESAREIMDMAILDYFRSHGDAVPHISQDINSYSKFLTETAILVAATR